MGTTELIGAEHEGRRPRRPRLAIFAGLFLAVAIALGAVQFRSIEGSPPPAQTVQISVEPGTEYPAALIHRLIAHQERLHPVRPPR